MLMQLLESKSQGMKNGYI